MSTTTIYRGRQRGLIWVALTCSLIAHIGAVVIAANKSEKMQLRNFEGTDEIIGIDNEPTEPPPQPDAQPVPEPAYTSPDDSAFVDEDLKSQRPKKLVSAPVRRSSSPGTPGVSRYASVKNVLLDAPRPAYPYEARVRRVTGSGIADLKVDLGTGTVVSAYMRQSTGSFVLDNATLSAFRRWRFRSGAAANVEVPITYTLTGASY